jgi:hypothetical protein
VVRIDRTFQGLCHDHQRDTVIVRFEAETALKRLRCTTPSIMRTT